MLWFWIILGCVAVLLFAVLEIRAERKPEKPHVQDHREGGGNVGMTGGG